MILNSQKSFPWISVIFLVLVNLIPLYGVIFLRWRMFSIIFIYWLESAVIGAFTLLKIGKAKGTGRVNPDGTRIVNLLDSGLQGFFLMHYGLFMFVHLIFILVFFWPPTFSIFDILLVIISLGISHSVSYFTNYLGRQEYLKYSPEQAMFAPYPRIVIMHITILFGGIVANIFGSPPMALALMILLKISVDTYSHLAEHNVLPQRLKFKFKGGGVDIDRL